MVTAPAERSELRGHRQQIEKSAALTVGYSLSLARGDVRAPRRTTSAAGTDSVLVEMMELGRWGAEASGRYGVSAFDRRVLRTLPGILRRLHHLDGGAS